MGIYVPCESADHLRVRCFAVLRSALLCASTLCYAESNDHWSLRVCPIPNLNLIPVVRLLARPALVMTLDWLLWAAHTISIGAASPLCSIFIHELERFRARAGFARGGGGGGGGGEVHVGGAAPSVCICELAPLQHRRRPICMRVDQQDCTKLNLASKTMPRLRESFSFLCPESGLSEASSCNLGFWAFPP